MKLTNYYCLLFFIFVSFTSQGQQIDKDTIHIFERKFFQECADSLENIYQIQFEQHEIKYCKHYNKQTLDKNDDTTQKIKRHFAECQTAKIRYFCINNCQLDSSLIDIVKSYDEQQMGFSLPHFEHNDTIISDIFKCILKIDGSIFSKIKELNTTHKLTFEVQSYSSIFEREGISFQRLQKLKKYFQECGILTLEHIHFVFKDYGKTLPIVPNSSSIIAKKNNRIMIKVFAVETK